MAAESTSRADGAVAEPFDGLRHGPRRRVASPSQWTQAFLSAWLLAVLLPALLLPPSVPSDSGPAVALAWLVVVWSALRLVGTSMFGERRFASMTFWLFVYVFFGLAPLFQLVADEFFLPEQLLGSSPSPSLRLEAMLVVVVGLAAAEVGMVVARRTGSTDESAPTRPPLRLDPVRLRLFGIGALVVSAAALAVSGGLAAVTGSRETFNRLTGFGGGNIGQDALPFVLIRMPPAVAFVLHLHHVRRIGWRNADLGTRLWVVVLGVATLVIDNPKSTPRFLVGSIALGAVFSLLLPRNRRLVASVMVLTVAVLVVLFPYLDIYRRDETGSRRGGVTDQMLTSQDYSMYTQVQATVEFVQLHGFTNGRQATSTLFFFVPRSVWQGKPFDTGDVVFDALGYPRRLNESAPLWSELFVDGGWLLLASGFAAYGFVLRRGEDRFLRSGDALTYAACMFPLLAGYQIFVLRGALLAAVPRLVAILVAGRLCFSRDAPPAP